ncbi:MAG: GAF domain-containing protein [Phycisphaerae bacterium]|jgi:signal transduction histidine kinase
MATSARESILAAISKTNSFDEMGRRIVETCAEVFDAEVCTLWRRYKDEAGVDRLRLLAASAKEPQTIAQEIQYEIRRNDPEGRRADGVTGYVAQTGREVHITSLEQLKREYGFCWRGRWDSMQWAGAPEQYFRSLSAFPVVLGESVIGVFKLENKRGSAAGFPEQDRRTVREMVPDVAMAVHSFSLLEPHEQRLIRVPAKMVAALLQPFEPRRLINEIVKAVAENLHAEICSLWLVDPSGKELHLADGVGFRIEAQSYHVYHLRDPSVPNGEIEGITAWVAAHKQPFWAKSWDELKHHASWRGRWDEAMWLSQQKTFKCLYAVPLLGERDAVVGVLKVENRQGEPFFTETDRALCRIMASLIVLTLEVGQRVRTSLLSDLAHLIRSPIGQVPMNLSGLERELRFAQEGHPPRYDRIHRHIDFIKQALMAAMMPTRALVAVAQHASDPAVRRRPEATPLAELVNSRLKEAEPLLHSDVRIERDFAADIDEAVVMLDVVDRTDFGIVVDNILHNAIKYSRAGGAVRIRLRRDGQAAILTVKDTGHGIPPDDLLRIWDAGFSRRASGHPGGIGMGLTAVKQILDRFGWERHVESAVGRGTAFSVHIPVQ